MWGSRSETMWKAGLSRRKCSKSCGKLKAASGAVLPSGHRSLGRVKLCEPGQGIRSLLATLPGQGSQRGSWRIPWRLSVQGSGSLAPALLLWQHCPWSTLLGGWEWIRQENSVQHSYQWAVLSARRTWVLSPHSVPADELTLCPSVPRGCCFWLNRQQLCKDFLFYTILCVSMTGSINT